MKFLTRQYFPVPCPPYRHLLYFSRQTHLYQRLVHVHKLKDVEVLLLHLSVSCWCELILLHGRKALHRRNLSSVDSYVCFLCLVLLAQEMFLHPKGELSVGKLQGSEFHNNQNIGCFSSENGSPYITNSNSLVSCLLDASVCSHALRHGAKH